MQSESLEFTMMSILLNVILILFILIVFNTEIVQEEKVFCGMNEPLPHFYLHALEVTFENVKEVREIM